ncbi:glycine hydroxymethyltransferase [Acanthopleuribacter pedis]|uniref:Serine hydroxymethyltransferase n=1 Tax=Acanthopleuribacter pedis TaxID=442870 RepID=A0A8J7U1J6_9BACT|nr:glycine hydroxymethyltransferase [Acanthopleuribacter pedis]MBO1317597.1 glycine hydroxymethyltransferase [Acanthopleuribacter pedis]
MTSPQNSVLQTYLQNLGGEAPNSAAAGFYAALDQVSQTMPVVAETIVREYRDQSRNLKLIASENYSSLATQLAHGNLFTDKYAEGFTGHRFYAGCGNVDTIEAEACRLACELFDADHAFVQPHSGADANLVAFLAILAARVQAPELAKREAKSVMALDEEAWRDLRAKSQNHRLLGLDLYSGGHLTHGYRLNISGLLFEAHSYSVSPETGELDLDAIAAQAREVKPLILLAGYSAYPRKINFAKMREIADEVGAVLMVDMAHFAGLVAGKVFTGDYNPVAHAHICTSTTHKTLRGPRGGIVLCKDEFAEYVDKGCPMVLGGPLAHVMAAKAVAFKEALSPEFQTYAQHVVDNADALANACSELGMPVVSGGTDNHLMLIDVAKGFNINGRQAETALRSCGITLNRNTVPFDPNGPWYTSGLRLGTPAVTSLGMGVAEMKEIAAILHLVLSNTKAALKTKGKAKGQPSQVKYELDQAVIDQAQQRMGALLERFPLYPELNLPFLLEHFGMGAESDA